MSFKMISTVNHFETPSKVDNSTFSSIYNNLYMATNEIISTIQSQSQADLASLIEKSNQTNMELDTIQKNFATLVSILFTLIFLIGLLGNSLVVIVVAFNATMRSTTNLLILNLAIADLLFIVFCVPFTATDYALSDWPFGNIWCKIVQYLIFTLACTSNYTLVLMSLDRYLAVVHPIHSMSIRKPRNAYFAICLTWILILILCSPALITHDTLTSLPVQENNDTFTLCTFNYENTFILYSEFQIIFFLSSYLVPLFIAFSLYFLMLKRLWFLSNTLFNNSRSQMNSIRNRKRVTKMVVVVVLTFAFCWAPIQIILVLKSLNYYITDNTTKVVIQIAAQVLAYMNSCINPILYAFLSDNFRKAFHKVINCNFRRKHVKNSTVQNPNLNPNAISNVQTNINETGSNSCLQSANQICTLNEKNLNNSSLNAALGKNLPPNSSQLTTNQSSKRKFKIRLKTSFQSTTQTNPNKTFNSLIVTDDGLYLCKQHNHSNHSGHSGHSGHFNTMKTKK